MSKRNLAVFLWFLAGWSAGGLLTGLMGMPSVAAFVPGILVAALVWWDPTHVLWSKPAPVRRVRPINDVAAELDKRIEAWPVVETESKRA